METISIYLQYLYAPIAIALYVLHVKMIKMEVKVHDYKYFKSDIYSVLTKLQQDVHHLVKQSEENQK